MGKAQGENPSWAGAGCVPATVCFCDRSAGQNFFRPQVTSLDSWQSSGMRSLYHKKHHCQTNGNKKEIFFFIKKKKFLFLKSCHLRDAEPEKL
ncbi:MAG: hypothetical protein K2P27_02460 [Lachnospiraceae bacterium]|nr:hypothetical protein [Lachnospiraceae bacterium]